LSDVTGDVRTCPRASDIFFCKYCEYDSDCGTQVSEMSEEEREAHYKRIFEKFEEWRRSTFPSPQERRRDEENCLLCDRPGYPTDYYEPNFEGDEPTAVISLCQYHKASYMSHGIKRLHSAVQASLLKKARK